MARRYSIFYSFHFDEDVFRVQQIRNIGALEDNKPVTVNEWETVKRGGRAAIERWINDTMRYRQCVVVLVGRETANREWVQYEVRKAWNDGKGLLGIHVHNLKCPRNGFGTKGTNPFHQFTVGSQHLSQRVSCYDPSPNDAYGDISRNLENWIERAIAARS